MTYYPNNPFIAASTRSIATGACFVGREQYLEEIENRLVRPDGPRGSLAMIGIPDVGKLCLINKILLEHRTDLHQRRLIPIKIDLKTYTEPDKPDKFFRDLVSTCYDELEDLDLVTTKITKIAAHVFDEWDKRGGTFPILKRFFRNVLSAGIRIIFILDNFDHAHSLFKGDIAHIHWLRQLTEPDCQVAWVVLACKSISEIETVPKSLSVDMFEERHLGMFTEDDMIIYFRFLAQMGIALTHEHEQMIISYCGRHPYLLSLFGYHLVEDYAHQTCIIDIELERTFGKIEKRFIQSYERIIDLVLVNDDNNEKLRKLGQILFGPVVGIEQRDIKKMLSYELIHPNPAWHSGQKNPQPAYIAFSEHFQRYIHDKFSSLEKTEKISSVNAEHPSSWSQTMLPETRLLNRYKIIRQVETTAHSQVAKAWDTQFERFVAIKRLYLEPAQYNEASMRNYKQVLKREAQILGGIKHENIGLVYDMVMDDVPTIIMEWIEGKSLDQVLGQSKGLEASRVIRIGIKLAKALVYLHTKKMPVIHRDIKPANIILRDDDEPILIDFNIARADHADTIIPYDKQGNAISGAGTKRYAAPEQLTDPKHATNSVDIYGLGGVLYEALTGGEEVPSSLLLGYRKSPSDTRIPVPLWRILRAMLSQDPHARPSAQQLCQQLEGCLLELKNSSITF